MPNSIDLIMNKKVETGSVCPRATKIDRDLVCTTVKKLHTRPVCTGLKMKGTELVSTSQIHRHSLGLQAIRHEYSKQVALFLCTELKVIY